MPQTRHRTVIEIGVDDRQIKGLDKTLHRAFDDQLLASFERVLDRTGKTLEQMTKAAERFDALMRKGGGMGGADGGAGRGGRGGGGGGGGGGGSSADLRQLARAIEGLQRAQQTATAAQPGFMARAGSTAVGSSIGGYFGGLASNVGQDGFISRAVSRIPVIGGLLSGAIGQIQRYYGMHAAGQQSISRTVGGLGRRSVGGGFTGFGFARPEAMQQALGYAQGAGLSGAGANDDFMRTALELQMLSGVQGSEGVVRAGGVGLNGPNHMGFSSGSPQQMMLQAVSAGIQSGVRESRLGQFVQAATSVLESGRLGGTDLTLAGVLQTIRGVSGLGAGFGGEQGQRAMSGIVQTMGTFEAGSDAASLVAMRAVGFGTERSYHEATRFIQDHPEQALPLIMEQIRGMGGGNEDATRELMRMIMPRFGLNPSRQQMEALAGGDMSGFGLEPTTDEARALIERRRGAVGGAFGTPGAEAAFRNRQLALGGNEAVSGAARGIRNTEMRMTESTMVPVAQGINGVLDWLGGAVAAFNENGGPGLMEYLMGSMGDMMRNALGLPSAEDIPSGRDIAVRAGGGMQYLLNEGAATLAEGLGADPTGDTVQGLRHLGEIGRQMMEGSMDTAPAPTGPGATGPITPGATVEALGPEASLGDALRRARDALDEAAFAADRTGLAGEGDLALG